MNYMDDNRGAIQFRERKKQIVDFSGLRFGNITPTDCDGLIEYRDKAYILFELKHRGADVPHGQLVALVRAVDDWRRAGKKAMFIIAEHEADNPADDIDAASCTVRTYYNGAWYKPAKPTSLKSLVTLIISNVDRRN